MFSDGLAQEDLSNYLKSASPSRFLGVPLGYNQLDNDTPFASELVPIDDFESSTENSRFWLAGTIQCFYQFY